MTCEALERNSPEPDEVVLPLEPLVLPAAVVDREAEEEQKSELDDGVRYLQALSQQRMTLRTLADVAGESKKKLITALFGASEIMEQCQEQMWRKLTAYVARYKGLTLQPVMFVEHMLYDETEMVLRVRSGPDSVADKERAKVYVLQTSWGMLLKLHEEALQKPSLPDICNTATGDRETCLFLKGSFTPTLRICDRSTGEGVRNVVLSSMGAST